MAPQMHYTDQLDILHHPRPPKSKHSRNHSLMWRRKPFNSANPFLNPIHWPSTSPRFFTPHTHPSLKDDVPTKWAIAHINAWMKQLHDAIQASAHEILTLLQSTGATGQQLKEAAIKATNTLPPDHRPPLHLLQRQSQRRALPLQTVATPHRARSRTPPHSTSSTSTPWTTSSQPTSTASSPDGRLGLQAHLVARLGEAPRPYPPYATDTALTMDPSAVSPSEPTQRKKKKHITDTPTIRYATFSRILPIKLVSFNSHNSHRTTPQPLF